MVVFNSLWQNFLIQHYEFVCSCFMIKMMYIQQMYYLSAQLDDPLGIRVTSIIGFLCSVCLFSVLCLSILHYIFLILLQYNICPPYSLQYKFLLGKVVRREFSTTCCWPNIFCHKMITRGWILVFEVSITILMSIIWCLYIK